MRGDAFVSGGFLPINQRGSKLEENIHVCDCATRYHTTLFLSNHVVTVTVGGPFLACRAVIIRRLTGSGYATFVHLAGGDVEDPNVVGTRPDGSTYALPGVDSLNMQAPANPLPCHTTSQLSPWL